MSKCLICGSGLTGVPNYDIAHCETCKIGWSGKGYFELQEYIKANSLSVEEIEKITNAKTKEIEKITLKFHPHIGSRECVLQLNENDSDLTNKLNELTAVVNEMRRKE